MADSAWRPGTDGLLRAWARMAGTTASGRGFDFRENRQTRFRARAEQFLASPSRGRFADLWHEDVVVAHDNPGADLLVSTFDGDVADLAAFCESLRSADAFDPGWTDRLGWEWALWELYTRLDADAPAPLTRELAGALEWFGPSVSGSFDERMATVRAFRDRYVAVAGHPTAGTDHEAPVGIEIEQLCRAVATLGAREIAAELKGPHGDFYRYLYGGREAPAGRTDQVTLVDETPVVYAYARGKANGAYGKEDRPDVWGGNHWEDWKDDYAAYFAERVGERYDLTELEPGDVEPLFEDVTRRDATDLGASVAEYLMGGQWGQYVWDDVVEYFVSNPEEASGVLSLFFDGDVHVTDRLQAFREHTVHVAERDGRSPGSIERMATSLLMLAAPDEHVGLPPRKTSVFLEDRSTLPEYMSGFRPRQYHVVVHPLRTLRDEIAAALDELGAADDATMLDVHNVLWIYENEGDPRPDELPPDVR